MITIEGNWFKDKHGRSLLLRGVNLGGSSKLPRTPNGATHRKEGFYDHRNVSFVGRPFDLRNADEHFARLKSWGLTFLRFQVTWEAIEHAGPGIYDIDYLDYIRAVAQKAAEYNISLFIDPHQDVWSRFSGGDGAPGWTFETIGMDMRKFSDVGAAITHQNFGDPFPRMIWPTNYSKLAAATMFTLFFAGNDFAPQTKVDGVPIQDYLQTHYLNAMKVLAARLRDLPNVVGYDTLNEPSAGYVGLEDVDENLTTLMMGEMPSPFQSMAMASGFTETVEFWQFSATGPRMIGRRNGNPRRVKLWKKGHDCLWRQHGVWDVDEKTGEPIILQRDYFAQVNGRSVNFNEDYLKPFQLRFAKEIRTAHPNALIFLEAPVLTQPPSWTEDDPDGIVHAAHWYDFATLLMKQYRSWISVDYRSQRPVFFARNIERIYREQLAAIKKEAENHLQNAPTLIGEIGIPFDLAQGKAFKNGDFQQQVQAMDRSLSAVEDNLLHCTIWNYTADNTNERGDQWNGEDLSIFSRDQQSDPNDLNSGGRALEAVIRPYPIATAGMPVELRFDLKRRAFFLRFQHSAAASAPTLIFLPRFHYPNGANVTVSDGEFNIDWDAQTLTYRHSNAKRLHTIKITPK